MQLENDQPNKEEKGQGTELNEESKQVRTHKIWEHSIQSSLNFFI